MLEVRVRWRRYPVEDHLGRLFPFRQRDVGEDSEVAEDRLAGRLDEAVGGEGRDVRVVFRDEVAVDLFDSVEFDDGFRVGGYSDDAWSGDKCQRCWSFQVVDRQGRRRWVRMLREIDRTYP